MIVRAKPSDTIVWGNQQMVTWAAGQNDLLKCLAFLQMIGTAAPRIAMEELTYMAAAWHREIQLHMPVDSGLTRAHVAFHPAERVGDTVTAAVGSDEEHTVYLEFGTKYIAEGRVKNWKPGDEPILDWAAKRNDASPHTAVSRAKDGTLRNVKGQFIPAAKANQQEFMPPYRGSWQVITAGLIDRLRSRVATLMKDGEITSA